MVTINVLGDSRASLTTTRTFSLRRAICFPVLMGTLLVGGSFVGAKANIFDPDTWWHITVGQNILTTHTWPTSDPYSYTVARTPWVAYEWLGEVVMGGAARLGGLRTSTLLLVALAGLLLVLMYILATLRCGNSKAAFVACATLLPIAAVFFTLRPQLFGYIFLTLTLICLERYRQGHSRALWWLPPIFLCWVNTHGSFAFGFVALGVYWACGQVSFSAGGIVAERWTKRQSLRLMLVILLCVLVLPITPYGTHLASYPLIMALSQPVNVNNIQEWQPVGPALLLGKFFLGVLLLTFLVCLIQRPKFRFDEIVLLFFGIYSACVHLRFMLPFMILFVPLWALLLSRWVPAYEPERDHCLLNAGLMTLIVVGMVSMFPSSRKLDQMAGEQYPLSALKFMKEHPIRGRMLNEYGWGGYLISAASPQYRVFIDGRADIYEYAGVLSDYLSIVRLEPNALRLLRTYDIDACLIERDAPLGTVLAVLPDWQRVYQDKLAVLYVRRQQERSPHEGAPGSP